MNAKLILLGALVAASSDLTVSNWADTQRPLTLPSISTAPPGPYQRPTLASNGAMDASLEPTEYHFSTKDQRCLALNIYWEARDQDVKGMLAVGLVTMKRVQGKHYPNTVCEVVWQKNKDRRTQKEVAQFSWTLDGKSDYPRNKPAWRRAKNIASAFNGDGGTVADFTKGSYLYHADYVNPYWKKHYQLMATIGNHLFYK